MDDEERKQFPIEKSKLSRKSFFKLLPSCISSESSNLINLFFNNSSKNSFKRLFFSKQRFRLGEP